MIFSNRRATMLLVLLPLTM